MARAAQLVATGALAVAAVVGCAAPARAVTAPEAGWWTTAPLAVAPDGPPDALVVEGGIDAPRAYAAVRYSLGPGERPSSLMLRVVPGALSTPATTLALCLLTEPFEPARGGRMADAPAFDCGTSVKAPASADGTTYRFDVAALVRDGAVAVAILPTAPTDRVVLALPGADSLATSDAAPPRPSTTPSPTTAAASGGEPPAGPSAPMTSGSSGAVGAPRPAVTPPAAPSAAPQEQAAAPSSAGAAQPAAARPAAQDGGSNEGSWLPRAVFLGLAALAASLWLGRGAGAVPST